MTFVIVAIVAVGIAAALLFLRPRRAIVIGQQLAAAHARDLQHRQDFPHLRSPLPPRTYDSTNGEFSLIDPHQNELDHELRALCHTFSSLSAPVRQQFRDAATADDFYTLLNFARRASVFALRERSPKWVEDGLTAAAMIDLQRIDERDLPLLLSFLHHVAGRLQLPALELFDAAANIADARTAAGIREFVRQPSEYTDIESSWGQQEILTAAGAGFVERQFEEYRPTRDLLRIALAVREALRLDQYEADVALATELPVVWFPSSNRQKAAPILSGTLGTASVHGTLRSGVVERAEVQQLLVFITEAKSEQDAAALDELADHARQERLSITNHMGPVFLIAVAQSFEVGIPRYETAASVKRFEPLFTRALQSAGPANSA